MRWGAGGSRTKVSTAAKIVNGFCESSFSYAVSTEACGLKKKMMDGGVERQEVQTGFPNSVGEVRGKIRVVANAGENLKYVHILYIIHAQVLKNYTCLVSLIIREVQIKPQ